MICFSGWQKQESRRYRTRQAEVQSRFLDSFGALYPQLTFRGVRRFPARAYGPYGFALRVAFGKAGIELTLLCAILTDGFPQDVARYIQRIKQADSTGAGEDTISILVAPYFSAEARALCHEAGIGYFDLAGNAGLDTPRVFLKIQGRENVSPRERQLRTPFEGKAERLVRALLLDPEKHWTMRELAQVAGISLGLASMVTSALASMGLAAKNRTGLRLLNPGALLDAWAQSYDLRRSAFCVYRSLADVAEVERKLANPQTPLGGPCALTLWSGAHCLLQEENDAPRLAFYYQGTPEQLARTLHWTPDKGKTFVFVFQPYDESLLWRAVRAKERLAVVHPLQLYLDLISGDEEELRLAQRVRERLLPW